MNHLENFLNKYIGPIANYMVESKFFSSMSETFMRTSFIIIGAAVLGIFGIFPI